MTIHARAVIPLAFIVATAACGGSKSPTAPTPTATPTKIIQLSGDLNFGGIGINQSPPDGRLTVGNSGTANLTVTGISGPCAGQFSIVGSSSFAVAPGGSVSVAVRYRPTTLGSCSGNITVASDATSGTSTIAVNASGTLDGVPVFVRNGTGDDVFTLPSYVTRVRVVGSYSGTCQNFIMRANGSSFINVIIGTCSSADTRSPFSGTYTVAGGAQVSTVSSTGVSWSVTEVR